MHYLKVNHNTELPTNIIVVDTEANIAIENDTQAQTFRLGYAIHLYRWNNDEWRKVGYELHSIEDFWKMLDDYSYSKKRLYVFAHNMAYDYTILKMDSYLSSRHFKITTRVMDSVFLVKAVSTECPVTISLISTTNFYQKTLKELGKVFGLSKMDSPNFKDCTDSELMPYCIRDTEVLTNIVIQHLGFIKTNDLGSFKPTIAGQAMGAYRHRFMPTKLLVHTNDEILKMEKESYRGGRCEAFRIGSFEGITGLDINSMYPFVMRSFDYPTIPNHSFPFKDISLNRVIDALSEGAYIMADCKFDMKMPFLAVKREKLLFPIGRIRQTVTSPELKYIIEHPEIGSIKSIDRAVFYRKSNIFKDYVNYFYSIRQNTKNDAIHAMCKIMLNSLYGKFGQHQSTIPVLVNDANQRRMYFEIMNANDTHEVFTADFCKYIRSGNDLYKIEKKEGDFARDSIPIIASTVTAYARIQLYEMMNKAGFDNIYYCDTDSLFVNEIGLQNLSDMISPSELGMLKIEKSGSCQIRGAKDYTFNDTVKLKGIKHDAVKLNENTFKQYQFQTKNLRYRNGTPDGTVIVNPVIKVVNHLYDKGVISGDHVRPHTFMDW